MVQEHSCGNLRARRPHSATSPNHHAFPLMTSPTPEKPNPRRVEVAMNPLKSVLCVRAGKCNKAMLLLSAMLSLSYHTADAFSVPHTSPSAFLRLRASHAIPALSKRHGLPSGSVLEAGQASDRKNNLQIQRTWARARTRAGFTGVRAQGDNVKFGLGVSAIPVKVLSSQTTLSAKCTMIRQRSTGQGRSLAWSRY